jgi:hypothetical protein
MLRVMLITNNSITTIIIFTNIGRPTGNMISAISINKTHITNTVNASITL